jgi:hypothetical protein
MGSLHFILRILDLVYRAPYLVIPFPPVPLRPSTSNKFCSFVAYSLKKSTRNDFPPYSTPLLNRLISLDFSRSLRKVTQYSIFMRRGNCPSSVCQAKIKLQRQLVAYCLEDMTYDR